MVLPGLSVAYAIAVFAIVTPTQAFPYHYPARRDLTISLQVLSEVGADMDKLVTAVNNFTGSPDQFITIRQYSEDVIKRMDEGCQSIQKSYAMSLADGIVLVEPIKRLEEGVEALFTTLHKKRPSFTQVESATILDQLRGQQASTRTLTGAIVGNLPIPGFIGGSHYNIPLAEKFDVGIQQWCNTA
jgi:hypothetical protein